MSQSRRPVDSITGHPGKVFVNHHQIECDEGHLLPPIINDECRRLQIIMNPLPPSFDVITPSRQFNTPERRQGRPGHTSSQHLGTLVVRTLVNSGQSRNLS